MSDAKTDKDPFFKKQEIRAVCLGLISLVVGFVIQIPFLQIVLFILSTLIGALFLMSIIRNSLVRRKYFWIIPAILFTVSACGFHFGRFEYTNEALKLFLTSAGISFIGLGLFVTLILFHMFFSEKETKGL